MKVDQDKYNDLLVLLKTAQSNPEMTVESLASSRPGQLLVKDTTPRPLLRHTVNPWRHIAVRRFLCLITGGIILSWPLMNLVFSIPWLSSGHYVGNDYIHVNWPISATQEVIWFIVSLVSLFLLLALEGIWRTEW